MSEVPPPSPAPPPAQLAALVRIIVASAPPALSELPPGTKLDVVVAEILDALQVKISTQLGDVNLKVPSQLPLKTGDALILQVLTGGGAPRVLLTTPDGQPLLPTARLSALPASSPATSGAMARTAETMASAVRIGPGIIVTATLLRPITVDGALIVQSQTRAAAGTPAAQASQPGGPGLSGGQAGATPSAAASSGTLPTAPIQSGGAAASGPQGGTGANQVTFPTGSGLEVKVVSLNVPATLPNSFIPPAVQGPVSLAPGATLGGVVSGQQGVGQTVVQTHAGPVVLPTAQALPPGTEIKFEIAALNPPTTGAAQHGQLHAGTAPLLDGSWYTFDEALEVLHDAAPGAHQHVLHAALPRADAQLATNVLFFLSVLRGGDIRNWLGDGPVRILEKMRPDLAGRLRSDMSQMTRTVDDPLSGEWRLMGVPFLHGADIDRVQLLLRDQDSDDNDNEDQGKGTRFVVDLNLSRLGHMQIDGLVGEKNKRLDLVLRTDEPLPSAIRDDIRKIYGDALELTGLEGSVGFQAQPGNFVNIPKQPAPGNSDGVVA